MRFLACCFMLFSKKIVTLQPESQDFRANAGKLVGGNGDTGLPAYTLLL